MRVGCGEFLQLYVNWFVLIPIRHSWYGFLRKGFNEFRPAKVQFWSETFGRTGRKSGGSFRIPNGNHMSTRAHTHTHTLDPFGQAVGHALDVCINISIGKTPQNKHQLVLAKHRDSYFLPCGSVNRLRKQCAPQQSARDGRYVCQRTIPRIERMCPKKKKRLPRTSNTHTTDCLLLCSGDVAIDADHGTDAPKWAQKRPQNE